MILLWGAYSLPFLIWIKLLGYAIQVLGYYYYRRDRLILFHNLGFSIANLITSVVILDLLVSMLVLVPLYVSVAA